MGKKYHEHVTLRISFWYKLLFIIIEIALAIPFGVFNTQDEHVNTGAVLEWVIALIFTGYIISFMVDLIPGLKNHSLQSHYTERKSVSSHSPPQIQYADDNPANVYGPSNGYGQSGYRTPPAHF